MGYVVITKAGKTPEVQDILRLSARQTADILRRINDRAHDKVATERRQSPRLPYQHLSRLAVILENEQRGRRTYTLAPRNISREGISLLHGKFVYGGTACVVGLQALDGQVVPVHGKVIWCRLVAGRVHELGVQFDESIDVEEFVVEEGTKARRHEGTE